jgi:hypothetical protein
VWEEDFGNPPFDDWFLQNYSYKDNFNSLYLPNNYPPIIANGFLHMQTPSEMIASAVHNSSVAYGTWSFDFHIANDQIREAVCAIMFIGNDYGGGNLNLTGKTYSKISSTMRSYVIYITSGISIWSSLHYNSISLFLWIGTEHQSIRTWRSIGDYQLSSSINGSHNMTITRDSTQGEFHVYVDSEHLFNATNNEIITSEVFEFASFIGDISFDNLTICDSVGIPCPPTPTTTTTTQDTTTQDTTTTTNETARIEFGVLILVLVFSVFYVHKRKR